tara:strand:- start:194 stop:1384 length:1191 start_codon:yes stop_codon:yes gene_type:complete
VDKNQFQISNAAKGKSVTMIITGYISPWNKNAGAEIRKNFKELESKYDEINIELINCYGGSIWEGWPTYNVIRSSSKKVATRAEGLVASMGAILFLAPPKKENRLVAKGSRVMTHRASGGAMGDADHLIEQAELMRGMEDELIESVAEATGKEVETVRAEWFQRGIDKYFTPQQAVDAGIASEIINSKKVKSDPPEDVMNSADQVAIANFYNAQFEPPKQDNQNSDKKMEKLPLFIAALAQAGVELGNEANESEILNKVQELSKDYIAAKAKVDALESENTELKNAAEEQTKAAVKSLIDNAVKDGRIKEDQRESMTNYANTDLEGATKFINGLSPIKSFTKDKDDKSPEQRADDPNNRANWTLTDWRKNDPKGLAEMRSKEPDNYQELVKNHSNK